MFLLLNNLLVLLPGGGEGGVWLSLNNVCIDLFNVSLKREKEKLFGDNLKLSHTFQRMNKSDMSCAKGIYRPESNVVLL